MPIRVHVTQIDIHGFWGRMPHPPSDLTGPGTIIGMTYDEEADLFAYTVRMDYQLDEVFDLIEHEFRVLGLDTDAQGAPPAAPTSGLLVRLWNGILTYRHRARA